MKRAGKLIITWLICLVFMAQTVYGAVNNDETYTAVSNETEGWPQAADTYSDTAVLMDAETGQILYDKGKDQPRYPASITKIMTTLLALEKCELTDEVTFTDTGLARMWEGTNLGMQPGEVLTMEQCLYAVMIKSANEIAAQVAEYVAGSESAFADMMNARAAELGCTNTHFANASGLPDENHWTTANDMALIFREALNNEEFVKIIGTLSYTIPPTNMNSEARTVTSHHALVVPSAPEYYEGCLGGKTGVTDAAGHTLVTGAERDGVRLIVVAMRAESGEVCADTTALFNYGFDNFERIEVTGGTLVVPKGVTEADLEVIPAETENGIVNMYSYNGWSLRQLSAEPEKVESEDESDESPDSAVDSDKQKSDAQKKLIKTYKQIIKVMICVIAVLILLTIIKSITNSMKRKNRRKKRNKR